MGKASGTREIRRRWSTADRVGALFWVGFVLFPFATRAQQEAARFQQDPVEQVGARVLVTLAIIGIGVVTYSLLKYRGAAVGPVSWGLLIAGAVAFPLLITGVGTILVFERAERVEFCASCHVTMKAFVDDMRDPKSDSLAALHFKNRYIPDDQCYSCHTSYGLFGTVEAKKEGLNDVYKYYTRTFHLPITLRMAADEPADTATSSFFDKILAISREDAFHAGQWNMLPISSEGDSSSGNLVVYEWRSEKAWKVIAVNLSAGAAQGRVHLADRVTPAKNYVFYDELNDVRYPRSGEELSNLGLFIRREAFEAHLFDVAAY